MREREAVKHGRPISQLQPPMENQHD